MLGSPKSCIYAATSLGACQIGNSTCQRVKITTFQFSDLPVSGSLTDIMPIVNELVPKIGYSDAKEKHNGSEAWLNFARRVTRNPFVKAHLSLRGNKCAHCSWPLNMASVVHHVDYDHACSYPGTVRFSHPTAKRPNRSDKVPDCGNCKLVQEGAFLSCMGRLVLVHKLCNLKISIPQTTDHFE